MVENLYLKKIDSNEKAYCLGFLINLGTSNTSFADYSYELSNIDKNDDRNVLNILKNVTDIIYDENNDKLSVTLHDFKLFADIINSLNDFMSFTDEQKKHFLRGLYEYSHLMNDTDYNNDVILIRPPILLDNLLTEILDYVNIPYIRLPNKIIFKYGCSSVDFLGFLYSNIDNTYSIKIANYTNLIPNCSFIRTDENAIVPTKANWSDVGYDLSIIKKVKDFNSKTALYDTGIKIQLDFGYYAEIVPRSSISKSGYILANNIGIIDNSYRGNLFIALTKIADDAIEIEYPFKCCQLIFKKQLYVNMKEIPNDNFETTKRDTGGFGSTGN